MKVYIKAIDYALPDGILTNEQVAAMFPEWTVEKIEKKLGIKQRHITAENETASDIAIKAAEQLFAKSDITKEEIDYLIKSVTEVVEYLRSISPFWRDLTEGKRKHVFAA